MSNKKLAKLVAELFGTFALTAVVLSVSRTYGTPIFTTIAAGATLAGLVGIFGSVSGGHFNPAITLGLLSIRKIKVTTALTYVAMQVAGAVLAWRAYDWLIGDPARGVKRSTIEFDWKIFAAELIGTALFAMAVAAAVHKKQEGNVAGATVGMGLFVGSLASSIIIVGRQIVSGVLNPAVAIGVGYGPFNQNYYAYFFGPVLGAVLGMNMYRFFFSDEKKTSFKPVVVAAPKAVAAAPVASAKAKSVKKVVKKSTKKVTKK